MIAKTLQLRKSLSRAKDKDTENRREKIRGLIQEVQHLTNKILRKRE